MSAEEPIAKHPFTQARETWDAWSMANTMRLALRHAREHGNDKSLAAFAEHPEWTQGPGPLEALAANRTQVELLTGWRWQAVRHAREHGHTLDILEAVHERLLRLPGYRSPRDEGKP